MAPMTGAPAAAEEAALRAKIQALRNVLQAKQTRFAQPHRPSPPPSSLQPVNRSWNRFGASANRVWRNTSAAPAAVPAAAKATTSRAPAAAIASWKRPLKAAASARHATYQTLLARRVRNRMQLHVLKLEDGEYAKANGGFSLVRSGVEQPKPTASSRTARPPVAAARVSKLVRIDGADYVVARTGHSLKRMAAGETSKAAAKLSAVVHAAKPANVASRAQAVVLRARSSRLKKAKHAVGARTEYCSFFNRFGKLLRSLGYCNKKSACPFLHDSRRVAICRKFLRDACADAGCLLSHKHDQNKMPVCALFLRGACTRDGCKYRHVKVSSSAQACEAFLKGYCADGEACRLKHELPPKKRALPPAAPGTSVGAAKKVRVEAVGAAQSGSMDQENVVPSGGGGGVAVESGGLSIRPTIRFHPKHASGFPSLLSVRNALSR